MLTFEEYHTMENNANGMIFKHDLENVKLLIDEIFIKTNFYTFADYTIPSHRIHDIQYRINTFNAYIDGDVLQWNDIGDATGIRIDEFRDVIKFINEIFEKTNAHTVFSNDEAFIIYTLLHKIITFVSNNTGEMIQLDDISKYY